MKRSSARGRAACAAAESAATRRLGRCRDALAACRYASAELHARAAVRHARALPASSDARWIAEGALGTTLRIVARHAEAALHLRKAVRLARSAGPLALASAKNALG